MLDQLQHQYRSYADLRAMGNRTLPCLLKHHFPVVGHMVFAAGGRSGVPVQTHRNASQDKPFHDLSQCFGVTVYGLVRIGKHILYAAFHQFHNALTIMLSRDDARQFPIAQAGKLSKKVSQTCGDHAIRRIFQNVRISDNCDRRLCVKRGFKVIDLNGRNAGGKTVHRRSRCDCVKRQAHFIAEVPGHVVDRSGADRDHQVTAVRHVDGQFSQGSFVKSQMGDLYDLMLDPCILQKLIAGFSGNFISNRVTDQIYALKPHQLHQHRQLVQRLSAYPNDPERCIVLSSAFTGEALIQIGVQIHGARRHFHMNDLLLPERIPD